MVPSFPNVAHAIPHPFQWSPVPHSVVRDAGLAERLHREGISTETFLDAAQLEALRSIYQELHSIPNGEGGMFYSLYSQDLPYRESIHHRIAAILRPTLDRWFVDYKNVINSFVVKMPGKASEFSIHQDMTALDEFAHSPLSVWIPLWDIEMDNGPMCVVPRTHHLFSPYRGISFPFPFGGIMGTLRRYLRPELPRAGEAILFDPRILHNSLPNTGDRPRVAIICGIFPAAAEFRTCFREGADQPIDIYAQPDDYLLKYPNFMHNCHARPVTGEVVARVAERFQPWTAAQFEAAAGALGLEALDVLPPLSDVACHMIAEPDAEVRAPIAGVEPIAVAGHGEVLRDPLPSKKSFLSKLFGR